MNIGEEKAFLYGMMKDITEERRRLTDMYFSLKERIDALHKLEEIGVGDLSTKGFIDLWNDRNVQIQMANINREKEYQKELQTPRYDKIAYTLEQGQAERAERIAEREKEMQEAAERKELETRDREWAIQQAKKEADEDEVAQASLFVSEKISEQVEQVEQVGQKKKTKKAKKGQRNVSGLKTKEAIFFVKKILAEHGTPMTTKDLLEKVEELSGFEVGHKNFANNVMRRVMAADSKIERPTPGFYQYRG